MYCFKPTFHSAARLLGLACLLAGSASAFADAAADLQRCRSGASNQSQADCTREEAAARQQGVQAAPAVGDARLQANAEQRCAVLPEAERSSCLLRMQGEGQVSGSVGAGGILRELKEPAPLPPASPAPQ